MAKISIKSTIYVLLYLAVLLLLVILIAGSTGSEEKILDNDHYKPKKEIGKKKAGRALY